MEATCSSETSVDSHQTASRYIAGDRIFLLTLLRKIIPVEDENRTIHQINATCGKLQSFFGFKAAPLGVQWLKLVQKL
jgi:hypothetical protein